MIRIYQAQDLPQSQLLIDLLEHSGIHARLNNANAQAALGEVPFTHAWPEIWLDNEADYDRARKLISEFERSDSGIQWKCSHCEEYSPGSFELCWYCESERVDGG